MRADDVLDLVRAHDPAAELPPVDPARRETLRLRVLSTPLPDAARRRRRPQRLLAVAVGCVMSLLLAGAGWAIHARMFLSASEVRSDFRAETASIPLPPGARWTTPSLDEAGVYAGPAAKMYALDRATCAWLAYWNDGFERRDEAQMTDARAGFVRVRALMPLHEAGASED